MQYVTFLTMLAKTTKLQQTGHCIVTRWSSLKGSGILFFAIVEVLRRYLCAADVARLIQNLRQSNLPY